MSPSPDDTAPGVADTELSCQVCGKRITRTSSTGAAPKYCAEHNPRTGNAARKPRVRDRAKPKRASTPVSPRPPAKGAPTHAALEDALGTYLVFGSALFAWWLTKDLNLVLGPDEQNPAELTDDEAAALSDPFVRVMERTGLSRYGNAVVGGLDYLVAATAAVSYTQRVAPLMAQHAAVKASTRPVKPDKRRRGNDDGSNGARPAPSQTGTQGWTPGATGGVGPAGLDL